MEGEQQKAARKQVKERIPFEPFTKRPRFQRNATKYRCNPTLDSGSTRAHDDLSNFCLRFARGTCHEGAECAYLHRLPSKQDEDRFVTLPDDIFGRPRRDEGASIRSGAHRTLYVDYTGASGLAAPDLRPLLAQNFREWGALESVRLIKEKAIAFVKFELFVSACFAKEAMQRQHLTGSTLGEVLLIKWAKEDMSAAAQEREGRDQERALAAAFAEAVNEPDPEAKRRKLEALHASTLVAVDTVRRWQPEGSGSEALASGRGDYRDDHPNWYEFYHSQHTTNQAASGAPVAEDHAAYYVAESGDSSGAEDQPSSMPGQQPDCPDTQQGDENGAHGRSRDQEPVQGTSEEGAHEYKGYDTEGSVDGGDGDGAAVHVTGWEGHEEAVAAAAAAAAWQHWYALHDAQQQQTTAGQQHWQQHWQQHADAADGSGGDCKVLVRGASGAYAEEGTAQGARDGADNGLTLLAAYQSSDDDNT